MSERMRPLAETNTNPEIPTPHKSSKNKENASPGSSGASETTANGEMNDNDATLPKFVRIARPYWDIETENHQKREEAGEEDDGESDDESEDEQETLAVAPVPNDDDSEWVWIISEEGMARYKELEKQASNRDQDAHGMHIYNDFTAYGMSELVDNWLKNFNKEISRRKVSPYAVWAELESLSMFLQLDYVDEWFHGDDCHGFAERISMIGKALLTGLRVLKTYQLSNPHLPEDCGLKNISLVLALFVDFVDSWTFIGGDHYGETEWVPKLGKLAKQNKIDIKGPYAFKKRTEELFDEPEEREKSDEDIKYSDDYSVKGWKEEFKVYTKRYATGGRKTIGGNHYDITKMRKAEKRQLRFDLGGGGWGW